MQRLLALALFALPSVASAQIYVPAPRVYIQAPPPPTIVVPAPPRVFAPPPGAYAPPPGAYAPPPPAYAPPPPLGSLPPHVYIRERIRWHLRRHLPRVVVVAPPVEPPQVYVQPGYPPPAYPPPPPAYPPVPPPIVAPAPQVYYVPAPPPAPPPVLVVTRAPRKPVAQWGSKIGLGVRGTGQVIESGWNNLGIGGEFLYRASPHLVTELAAEYQRNPDGPLDRTDIPITLGLRLHIGRPDWIVSPYFVVAAGLDIGMLDLKFASDTAYYFDAQLGGGLELRLGQHFAITADARFDGKKRINDPDQAVATTKSLNGKPFHSLDDEYGGQFRLGLAVYF
jgi:hypothetical protein